MENKQRGRPNFQDRTMVRQRINVSMLPEIKEMAKACGDGNVSQGVEMAVRAYFEANKYNHKKESA